MAKQSPDVGVHHSRKALMNIRTLSAIVLAIAAVSTPALAQADSNSAQKQVHALRHYRGAYNQAPGFAVPRVDEEISSGRVRPGQPSYLEVPGN